MIVAHFLGFYPEIGGPLRSTGNLIKSLRDKDVNSKIISPLPPDYDTSKLNELKKEYDVLYYDMDGIYKVFPSYSSKLSSVIENNLKDVDIIHLHGVFDYYTYFVCRYIKNIPVVLSPRGSLVGWGMKRSISSYIKKEFFLKTIGKMIFNRSNIIHFTTKYERDSFINIVGDKFADKMRIIPNGLSIIEHKIESDLFIKKFSLADKKIILFIGRVSQEKALDLLIIAFARLLNDDKVYKEKLLLVIAGPDEKGYKKVVEELIDKYSIRDNVLFTGHIDGDIKWSAYKSAEIFVLPSYTENFGMSVVEAMSCGAPVVVSNMVGIQKEIDENNAGIIVETNVDSLYKGMKTLLENPKLREEVSRNGKRMVYDLYDINKVADKMIKMYEEAINSH